MNLTLSAAELRGLAESYRNATDAGDTEAIRAAGVAMAKVLESIPVEAEHVVNDASHFTILRGWGHNATPEERAQTHINMAISMADEPEETYDSPQMRTSASNWIPAILGDLFLLAETYNLNALDLIAEGHRQLVNYR